MKRKILHIISGLGDGGAEGVLYRLIKDQDDLHEHHVLSLTDFGKYGDALRAAGVNVRAIGLSRKKIKLSKFIELIKVIKALEPDLIQTWMYHADLIGGSAAKLLRNSKIVWNIRHSDLIPGEDSRLTIIIAKISAFFSYFIPKKIVCCAEAAYITHAELGYRKSVMSVIPNGFDHERYKRQHELSDEFRKMHGVSKSEFFIGMVARNAPQKDHLTLFRALKKVKDSNLSFKCILVGHEIPLLIDLAVEFGLKDELIFLGSQRDVKPILSSLDLHVLSSSHGEGFPNVLAEAMLCGVPCIATNVGDSSKIIGDLGIVVSPKDANSLADAIGRMAAMRNTPAWSEKQRLGRAFIINEFGLIKMKEQYRSLWKNCMD